MWSWSCALALGEAVALQDVAHRLVTDGVAKVGQGADNAIIAPGTVLLRHAHYQVLHFLVDRGTTGRFALLGAVKLLGDQFAVPAKNRVGLDDGGHFLQGLLPNLWPMAASVMRSPSFNRTRPLSWLRRIRFSVTRYSLRSSSS